MSANPRYGIRSPLVGSTLKLTVQALLASVVLTACSGMGTTSAVNPINWITPYRVDVIQGNFISKEQVSILQAGMTRAQVKEVLGTPLVASLFHADRWDYVFSLRRQGVESQSYKYAVFFKGDLLERFEGDTMPSESEFISRLDNKRKLGKVPVLEATEEQLKSADQSSGVKSGSGEAKPASVAASAPSTQQGNTVYPPLEGPKP